MICKARLGKIAGVAALMLSPLPALAQSYTYPAYTEPAPEVRRGPAPPSGYGSAVELGGGVMNFSGAAARNITNSGGAWNLRLAWGTRSILGFEAAYVGSANKLRVDGLDPKAALLGNGAEGALRLNAPFPYHESLIEPFAFGGVGWTQYDVINDNYNNSSIKERDHVINVPVGGGLATAYRGLMLDARYTYRFAYREALMGNTPLDNWVVSANIGSEF